MLPDLPRKNRRREDDFGKVFREWFMQHSTEFTDASFELKDTDGADCLPFAEVKGAQEDSGLRNMSDKGNLIRVLVASPGTADYLFYRNAKSYVVIRYPTFWCVVPLVKFLSESSTSPRKSLTSTRARDLSTVVIDI